MVSLSPDAGVVLGEARRHPDVRSARAQLAAHYARVWRQ